MKCAAVLIGVLILLPTRRGASQEHPLPVEPGQRVRVMTAPAGVWMTGTVTRLENDTLSLRPLGGDVATTILVSTLTRLQISEGRRSHAGKGAAIGALVLGAVGAALGYAVCAGSSDQDLNHKAILCGLVGAGGGGAGGALVGATLGATARSERWREIPLHGLSTSPLPRRTWGVTFALRF